jgi:hypothetical protein
MGNIKNSIGKLIENSDLILLSCMAITLVIQPQQSSIIAWADLNILLFVRTAVWLLGLLVLPGLYAIRVIGISTSFSRVTRFVIAINLSFVLISIAALIFYYASWNYFFLPIVLLTILTILKIALSRKSSHEFKIQIHGITRWHVILLTAAIVLVILSFSVQVNERFLIPGDNWVSLKPAVSIISQENVYQAFSGVEYPILFGFTLVSLAVCGGLPIVNTYVLLFPLAGLSIFTFYSLLKTVFKISDRLNVLACVLYAFGGGLGGLVQLLIYHGDTSIFWTTSRTTQDMYFSVFFWNSVQFSYKSLAITLMFASLIAFAVSSEKRSRKLNIAALSMSALLFLFSFLIHMLEAAVFAFVIFALLLILQRGRIRYFSLGIFLTSLVLAFLAFNSLMVQFYSSVILSKLQLFLSTVSSGRLEICVGLLLAMIPVAMLVNHFSKRSLGISKLSLKYASIAKNLVLIILIAVYLLGLFFWVPNSLYSLSTPFPWYEYVMRYGLLGGLAIIGLRFVAWKQKWFIIASLWSIVAIILGSLWWGERLNGYLFPMVALLAAFAIDFILTKTQDGSLLFSFLKNGIVITSHRLKLKPIISSVLVILIVLSFSSVLYGAVYYASVDSGANDNDARVFSWLSQNTPANATILVSDNYVLNKGTFTIGNRQVYGISNLTYATDPYSFANFSKISAQLNLNYAVLNDADSLLSDLFRNIITSSKIVFQAGNIRIYELPKIIPPKPNSNLVVVDRVQLGVGSDNSSFNFGWIDDSFASGWDYSRINETTDGEILSLQWQFQFNGSEPAVTKTIPSISTNLFPFIVIKYRNTDNTTSSAKNNVGQLITLLNESGYPAGYLENVNLPIATGEAFNTFVLQLPGNQNVSSILIWMRNYQKLNGTIGLDIDYIGFASTSGSGTTQTTRMRFLNMIIPSLWHKDYSIVNGFNETGNATIALSLYDESAKTWIATSPNITTFVFIKDNVLPPAWGSSWKEVVPGLMTGYLESKRVIIADTSVFNGNLTEISQAIYSAIFVEG